MKNPPWNREELILALDLYFAIDYGQMHGTHPQVKALSNLLSLMNKDSGFSRSPGSVSLKLANFKRIDPDFDGKGMTGGAQLEERIWEEYSQDKIKLQKNANDIKKDIIKERKDFFIEWLQERGKPDGSPYQQRTILVYAAQIQNSILKESEIDLGNLNLFEITDLTELAKIEKLLHQGDDSKKKRDLRSAYQSYLRFVRDDIFIEDSEITDDDEESYTEGGRKVYISARAERNVKLRIKAIKLHGTSCMACGFDFGKTYGIWGEGFVEVHHLIPLGNETVRERVTNVAKDLVVLCANCHRMVHRKKNITLTVEELKQKIKTVFIYDPA